MTSSRPILKSSLIWKLGICLTSRCITVSACFGLTLTFCSWNGVIYVIIRRLKLNCLEEITVLRKCYLHLLEKLIGSLMDRQGDRFVDVDESCHARLICSLIVKSFGINVPLPHYNLVVFMHIKS